jgi:hypothetical protein
MLEPSAWPWFLRLHGIYCGVVGKKVSGVHIGNIVKLGVNLVVGNCGS